MISRKEDPETHITCTIFIGGQNERLRECVWKLYFDTITDWINYHKLLSSFFMNNEFFINFSGYFRTSHTNTLKINPTPG